MPKKEQPSIPKDEIAEEGIKKEPIKFEFRDLSSAEEYLQWKQEIPLEFRRIVESRIKDAPLGTIQTGLKLTDQFLAKFNEATQPGVQPDFSGVDARVANLLEPLSRVETRGGYLNAFETLVKQGVSWKLRVAIYNTQIKSALEWLVEQDILEEAEKAEKKLSGEAEKEKKPKPQESSQPEQPGENNLPPSTEEVTSSMEAGARRKEDEPAKPIFSVKPFYGGYYRQLIFEKFGPNLRWTKAENNFVEATLENSDPLSAHLLSGRVRGGVPLSLPLPYNWTLDSNAIETNAPEASAQMMRNQDGLWYLKINAEGIFSYCLKLSRRQLIEENARFRENEISGELPSELELKIGELKKQNFPSLKLKREIVKMVRNHLVYSNDRQAWQRYVSKPPDFFKQIWEKREADCFVANTLAIRALAEVDSNTRFISGYFVKEKSEEGGAIMYSGNGHAWLEVYDEQSRRAIRLDATPKGDPVVDEAEQERDLEGEKGDGDYGEEELASEEEVKKQIGELKKKEGAGTRKEKISSVLIEQQFAELAECAPAQAREFLQALERVRLIRNEQGASISDLMKEEWRKIIEERKIEQRAYRGPVRMNEGTRLEDPVETMIDVKSREYNPTGFERDEITEKLETNFGGLDIYFSFDLSVSMAQPDTATGRSKADVQRDAALLFADSLMQCAYLTRQHGQESDLIPLKIMVTLASDTGRVSLHLTDKWGPKEQWAMYSALIRPAQGGTPTHQTLQLIEKDLDKEVAELKKKNIPQDRQPIHYVVEISDGAPDDFDQTETMHLLLKTKGAVVRSYPVGGASASEDAAPPLQSFSELPQILARDVIEKFRKLRPQKVRLI